MRYTEKQKAEFKERFIHKQRYQVAAFVPLAGAVMLLVVSREHVADVGVQTLVLGTVALSLATAAFAWLNWRCPACSKYLGHGLNPSHCPKCGVELASR